MKKTGNTRIETGRHAEQLAEHHLGRHGLRLLARNYRCRGGEIDLIMADGDSLVFVEVRYRKHQRFGGAAASVDWRKQQRLIHAAQYYLQQTHSSSRPCRFDVVAISPGQNAGPAIEWLTNAFELD